MLDTESNTDLVVGSFLQYEGVVLHVCKLLLAVEGIHDVTIRAILEYHSHLFYDHSTWVIRGFISTNMNTQAKKKREASQHTCSMIASFAQKGLLVLSKAFILLVLL
jgi:hypothetical protein